MLVSCLCPTFGRCPEYQHLLEEAIESFVRQDWEEKELILFNDCFRQRLACDVPDVRIINQDVRLSLGAKYNSMIRFANGDLLCPWEDDDISLSWRISAAVRALGDAEYWKPYQVIYWPRGAPRPIFQHPRGVRHHASIYRRSAWEVAGGYPDQSGAQDTVFDLRVRENCSLAEEGSENPDDWAYIYRWGVSPCHLSAFRDTEARYRAEADRPIEAGTFLLTPKWREDYESICRDVITTVVSS